MSKQSQHPLRKWVLFSVGGISIGVLSMAVIHLSEKNAQALRKPASFDQPWGPVGVGKHLTKLRVVIETPKISEDPNEPVLLRGAVQAIQAVNEDIHYQWLLPEDAIVVSGSSSGDLSPLSTGRFHIVELKVLNFNKLKFEHVSLEAGTPSGLGGIATISSRPEDTMESIGVEMRKEVQKATGQ